MTTTNQKGNKNHQTSNQVNNRYGLELISSRYNRDNRTENTETGIALKYYSLYNKDHKETLNYSDKKENKPIISCSRLDTEKSSPS